MSFQLSGRMFLTKRLVIDWLAVEVGQHKLVLDLRAVIFPCLGGVGALVACHEGADFFEPTTAVLQKKRKLKNAPQPTKLRTQSP